MAILKKVLLASFVVLPLASAAQAADAFTDQPTDLVSMTGLYLRGDVGASMLNWSGGSDDTTWNMSGGVGYQFNENVRTDITYDHSGTYDIGPSAKLSTQAVMGNVYFDWKNSTAFTPYVGVGAGYGWTQGAGYTDSSGVALGAMAGVSMDMTQNLALDVGYKFRNIAVAGPDTQEHVAQAGLRFKF
jgi:opacity protein-like surface antigen